MGNRRIAPVQHIPYTRFGQNGSNTHQDTLKKEPAPAKVQSSLSYHELHQLAINNLSEKPPDVNKHNEIKEVTNVR